jgi:hypothetical protein
MLILFRNRFLVIYLVFKKKLEFQTYFLNRVLKQYFIDPALEYLSNLMLKSILKTLKSELMLYLSQFFTTGY